MIWLFLAVLLVAVMLALASKYVVAPFVERWLALQERKVTVAETRASRPPTKPDEIPVDLVQYALNWRDQWARDDALKRLREMREETGSWDNVRTLFAPEQRH